MRPIDPTYADSAAIIPFAPRPYDGAPANATSAEITDEVSTIVAIVAVTLRHPTNESPEERLADLIESSGQAEIIEIQDACTEIFDQSDAANMGQAAAVNDNHCL